MGIVDNNCWIRSHYSSSSVWYDIRVHRGDKGVDTTSPTITHDGHSSLRDSTTTQAAFDEAADDIGGAFATWYNGLETEYQVVIRAAYVQWQA